MAKISAKLVKELREMTGAGMMDCKKALTATNGDIEKAVEELKKKGLGKASKKSDRLASEGLVSVEVSDDYKSATILEVNSETDFVAKNQEFIDMNRKAVQHIHNNNSSTVEEIMETTIDGVLFEEYFKSQIAKIGENLVLRRFAKITTGENGVVNGYAHSNGRVGVIIGAKCDSEKTAKGAVDLLKNIAMHAAAMKPKYISYKEFDIDFVNRETEGIIKAIEKENEERKRLGKPLKNVPICVSKIQLTDEVMAKIEEQIKEELRAEKKPEKIWDRIIPGKLERFIADNTALDKELALLSQNYALDDKKTVEQVIEETAKKLGGTIEIVEYVRFELGEGLAKKGCDFASEVAEQLK